MQDTNSIIKAAEKLLAALQDNEVRDGGLLTRNTYRLADELRLKISRYKSGIIDQNGASE